MAAGDETEVVTDTHIDLQRNRVTLTINILIERKDGSLVSVGSRTDEKDYQPADLETKTVSQLKVEVKKSDMKAEETEEAIQ